MKICLYVGLLLSFLSIFTLSTDVKAQENVDTIIQYVFGQSVTFDLLFDAPTTYTDFTLYVTTSETNISYESVILSENKVTVKRDLREQPFLPFSYVTFWWEYRDSNEKLMTTDKKQFHYTDNRYEWQTHEDDDILIYWVNGEKATMMNAVPIIKETIEEIQHALQTDLAPAMHVYFYPSQLDLQSALQLAGYKWIAGATYPELGVILVSVTDNLQAVSQMQRTLPHEVTHKMLYDIYGPEGYEYIPTWLEEGLASYFEPNPDPTYALAIEEANAKNTLLRYETLCFPFPNEPSTTLLSYAQSESMTRYFVQKYGWSDIRELFKGYTQEGIDCNTGLVNILGIQVSQFEREWRSWQQSSGRANSNDDRHQSIFQFSPEIQAAISLFIEDGSRWLLLGSILFLPFLFFCIHLLLKK